MDLLLVWSVVSRRWGLLTLTDIYSLLVTKQNNDVFGELSLIVLDKIENFVELFFVDPFFVDGFRWISPLAMVEVLYSIVEVEYIDEIIIIQQKLDPIVVASPQSDPIYIRLRNFLAVLLKLILI